jgi:ATP-dependent Clp protease ATP-binding subunit ClpB
MDFQRLEPPCLEALAIAQSFAVRRGHAEVSPGHLLLALLRQRPSLAGDVLRQLGCVPEEFAAALESSLEREPPEYSKWTRLAPELGQALAAAELLADARGSGAISPRHLLAGLAESGGAAADLLRLRSVAATQVLEVVPSLAGAPSAGASPATSPIRDLTAEARKGAIPRILGRDEAVGRLLGILAEGRYYPLLLGEEGDGRGALVEGLARALVERGVPTALLGARLLGLGRGLDVEEIEKRLPAWTRPGSKLFIYVEDPRVLAQLARSMRGFSNRDRVRLIGRATPEEYYGTLSRQHYLEGCFETVAVRPLSAATTVLVLRELRARFEERFDVEIADDAIEAAVDLAHRLMPGARLPGAALGVLDRAAQSKRECTERVPPELERMEARVAALQAQQPRSSQVEEELSELRTAAGWLRARWEQEAEAQVRLAILQKQLRDRPGDELLERRVRDAAAALPDAGSRTFDRRVTRDDVALVVERKSGARLGGLALEARADLLSLERQLVRDVLGQRPAARAVASTLMRASKRLEIGGGAGGSFLFFGPPGVGKTTMARSLAAHFLNDESAFVQLPIDDASKIQEAVERTPRLVVLVRDVHRAPPGVQRLLTRVLEGKSVWGDSRRVDFRQTLLVLSTRESKPDWLSPRVDGVVTFGPLSAEIARLIADREARALSERLSKRRIALEWSRAAVDWLGEHGVTRKEGAHRLNRILADEVASPLGRMLVLGELREGARTIVDVRDGRLEVLPLSGPQQFEGSARMSFSAPC